MVRAYDVPVRSDPDPLASHADGPKEALVHSYIEARFQVQNNFQVKDSSKRGKNQALKNPIFNHWPFQASFGFKMTKFFIGSQYSVNIHLPRII